ncbi:hypothetical protein ACEWAS_22705, partial [Vibrio parahaemolyticus]
PVDLASSKIKANQILEKIDGEAITASIDWSKLLNRKAGKNVLLTLYNPDTKERFEEVVKPIANEQGLLYDRWVANMRKMVETL